MIMEKIYAIEESDVLLGVNDEIDYFDHLPDPIVLVILNKVYDARSLCRCLAVSKRFASLVPEVGSVSISMNRVKTKKPIEDGSKSRNGSRSFFKNFVSKVLIKPFNFIQQAVLNNKKLIGSASSGGNFGSGVEIFNWVGEALKNFPDVESVKLELPCHGGEIGINKSVPLLKWEAGFGKDMEKCVILGATSVSQLNDGKIRKNGKKLGSLNEGGGENNEEQLFSDEELRLRIIWIISCLIASSGRHNLMKKMVGQCPKLRDAVISDGGKQGKLHMDVAQIQELRNSIIDSPTHTNGDNMGSSDTPPSLEGAETTTPPTPTTPSSSSTAQMACVGNLVMRLWYVKELELPKSGQVMKGATLVMITPENKTKGGNEEKDGVSLWGGFEGDQVFEEAAKELLKRKENRVYRLEMNSI